MEKCLLFTRIRQSNSIRKCSSIISIFLYYLLSPNNCKLIFFLLWVNLRVQICSIGKLPETHKVFHKRCMCSGFGRSIQSYMSQKSKSSKNIVITTVRLAKPVLPGYWHKFSLHRRLLSHTEAFFPQFRATLQHFLDYSDFFLLFSVSLRSAF